MKTKIKKCLLLIILTITLLSKYGYARRTVKSQINANYDFNTYKQQYHKNYSSPDKEKKSKEAFEKNLQIVKENLQSDQPYQLVIGQFSDYTQEEMKKMCNYHPNKSLKQPLSYPRRLRSSTSEPVPIDYRNLGKTSSVKHQGNCGSCWAYAAISLYESLLMIHTQTQYDLSQQFTTSCTNACYKCEGGFPEEALEQLQSKGAPKEQNLPYSLQNFDLSYQYTTNCEISSYGQTVKLPNNIIQVHYYFGMDQTDLKQALRDHGPVVVAVTAGFQNFYNYGGGIFTGCASYQGNVDHAVLLVGFTSEGHWIIKNSWGTNWGQNGYMTIHKDYNCKIADYVSYLQVEYNENSDFGQPAQEITDTSDSADITDQSDTTDSTDPTDPSQPTNPSDQSDPADPNIDDAQPLSQPGIQTFQVMMYDSFGDGWNGNTIGVFQGTKQITSFGGDFTIGSIKGPVTFSFNNSRNLKFVVVSYQFWTSQIGFTVKNITNGNNTIVFSRVSGSEYSSNIIFYEYCGSCLSTKVKYSVMCIDSFGDGWNSNSIAFKVDSTYMVIGRSFMIGHEHGPYQIQIERGKNVDIVPYDNGLFKQQIGFIVRDIFGQIIFERQPGQSYLMTDIFTTFCVDCTNLSPVRLSTGQWKTNPQISSQQQQQTKQQHQQLQNKPQNHSETGEMKAIIILSILLVVMTSVSILAVLFICKLYRNSQQLKMQESAYDVHKQTLTHSEFPDKSRNDIGLEKSLKSQNRSN